MSKFCLFFDDISSFLHMVGLFLFTIKGRQ